MAAPVSHTPAGVATPPAGTTLFWRARAVNAKGATSAWTQPQAFVVGPAPAAAGVFTVTQGAKVTGLYINSWDGTTWSAWTKVI